MIRRWAIVVAILVVRAFGALPEAVEPIRDDDPFWPKLARQIATPHDVFTHFSEQRWFPFRKEPVLLTGEARVSAERGLSLHYRTPEPRTVIIDRAGFLLRDQKGANVTPPADGRASAMNAAMLHIVRLDLDALRRDFDVFGAHVGDEWSLRLVPRDAGVRRFIGQIDVGGVGAAVLRIELRHSAKQRVEIELSRPMPTPPFTADDVQRFFR